MFQSHHKAFKPFFEKSFYYSIYQSQSRNDCGYKHKVNYGRYCNKWSMEKVLKPLDREQSTPPLKISIGCPNNGFLPPPPPISPSTLLPFNGSNCWEVFSSILLLPGGLFLLFFYLSQSELWNSGCSQST